MTEQATEDTSQATPATEQSNEPAWYLDDKTPGQGARPDWLPQNYKKVSDVVKSYNELEKKLGAFKGAPDAYDLEGLEIDANQHVVKQLVEFGKNANMSQEGFTKLVGTLSSALEVENTMSIEEEVKRLGPDGERQLREFNNWTKNHLKPEEAEVVSGWVKGAEDLQMVNRLLAHTHMSEVPTSHTMHRAAAFESVQELRTEMTKNIDRYRNDNAYRKDLSSRLARAAERERR